MAKYLLQNLEGETLDTKSKKDAAIKVATDQGLLAFRVVTDKGTVVYEQVEQTIADDLADLEDQAAQEAEEAPEEADEDLIGDVTPDAPSEPEIVFYEKTEFPGNYSIVTAPGALEVAAAAGVPARSTNVKGSLVRVVEFGGTDMDKAKAVKDLVDGTLTDALTNLKVWQKKHIERRRSLTDMQRYVEHREQIAKHFTSVARSVKKNGLPG